MAELWGYLARWQSTGTGGDDGRGSIDGMMGKAAWGWDDGQGSVAGAGEGGRWDRCVANR